MIKYHTRFTTTEMPSHHSMGKTCGDNLANKVWFHQKDSDVLIILLKFKKEKMKFV